ncbi:MAG: amino acid ABC transporter permease, partial [Shimia sp.]
MSDTHSESVGYVRETFLPQAPPPAREAGAVKWMRENLFSGWVNTILTILSIYFIIRIVIGVFPWFANGVWTADSLAECRQMLEGTNAACFAVLSERWNQMLFGIGYPRSEYWRPVLAFVLLFAAAAPVLFSKYLPRFLFIGTALYPFVAYWLIWGGTLWLPILVLAAIIATYFVFAGIGRLPFGAKNILGMVVGAITGLILTYWLAIGGLNLFALGMGFLGGGVAATIGGVV